MTDVAIEGTCDARFARVREAFAENFASRRETGASISIALDGRTVVDLWGGWADKARTRPWTRDTIVNVYSTTKGLPRSARIGSPPKAGSTSTRQLRITGPSLP
jgi:CubicO group peptidase (beta-lactamase class C family)